ncbi:O-antigen ligase family protein [Rhizobium sp. ICMP 5592]|uniref:O-antigen ligase family protein n=1 Tax=Rhizobium sp. ICMP 5592 TaxID=2292445 RepID=UPI0012975D82|nr:O-antigen ligase family protein [Rhizobium sp. ICMP 5592]MQB40610.1 O-antigen ligase family protein [Rhizobium sp. ICMP 5592]
MTVPAHSSAVRWAEPGLVLAIPLAIGFTWLGLCFTTPQNPAAALVPFGVIGAAGFALVLIAAALGRRWAVASLLVFVIFGLSLSLRQRASGETGLDWQNGLKLAVWMLIPLVCLANVRRLLPHVREPTIVLGALYGLLAIASGVWSLTPAYTVANALGFVAYLMLACLCVSVLGLQATLRLATFTLLAFVVLGLVAAIVLPDAAWLPPSAFEADFRLRGLSGHPNVLGEQAAVLVTFAIICYRRGILNRWVFIAALIAGFGALIAAESRTSAAAVIIVWIVIELRERRYLWPMAGIALLVGAIALPFIAIGGFPSMSSFLGLLARSGSATEITTLTGRTELWAVASELIARKPLFGWGFNGTEALMMGSVGRNFAGDPVNAHNMYVQTLLCMGFLGSLPAFAFLGIAVKRMVTKPDAVRDQVVLLVMIIGIAEVSLFATPGLLTLAFFIVLAGELHSSSQPATVHSDIPAPQENSSS